MTQHHTAVRRPLIFISHRVFDGEVARLLQVLMQSSFLGLPRFFNVSDYATVRPGDDWFTSIVGALKECDVLLALLSPAGRDSPWVNFESGAAWIRGAMVIPCCIGKIRKDSLPMPYSHLQAVDLDSPRDLESLMQRVAEQIGLDPPQVDYTEVASQLAIAAQSSESSDDYAAAFADSNRVETRNETEWFFTRSQGLGDSWAGRYRRKLELRVLAPELSHVEVELNRAIDIPPFGEDNKPIIELHAKRRHTSTGEVRVAPAHRQAGATFAFHVYFDPPLRQDERASLDVSVFFPAYKLSARERLADALLARDMPLRDYDYCSRTITRPTELFIYRVVIPKSLGASPLAPEVLRDSSPLSEEQEYLRTQPGAFGVAEEVHDDEPCWVIELKRRHPPRRAVYRLRWRLPRQASLP